MVKNILDMIFQYCKHFQVQTLNYLMSSYISQGQASVGELQARRDLVCICYHKYLHKSMDERRWTYLGNKEKGNIYHKRSLCLFVLRSRSILGLRIVAHKSLISVREFQEARLRTMLQNQGMKVWFLQMVTIHHLSFSS